MNWFEVPGAPKYKVNELGQIKGPRKILKLSNDTRGYPHFTNGYRGSKIRVHQVVCGVFHGPSPSKYHIVCHNDGNKTNNNKDNLRRGTYSDNMLDKVKHNTSNRGENSGKTSLTWLIVNKVRLEFESLSTKVEKSEFVEKTSVELGITSSGLRKILLYYRWIPPGHKPSNKKVNK